MIWGKVFGGMFGMIFGSRFGPLSSIFFLMLGVYLGDLFDQGLRKLGAAMSLLSMGQKTKTQFFTATFSVMGHIAKSDGRISEDEIQVASAIMARFGLTPTQKQQAISFYSAGKAPDFPWLNELAALRKACGRNKDILQVFIEIQLESAYVEGPLPSKKRQLLLDMADALGFNAAAFQAIEKMFLAAKSFQQRQQQRQNQNYQQQQQYHQNHQQGYSQRNTQASSRQGLSDAYAILGVSSTASMSDVKKAYRRQMSAHHPDKLMSKGLPEEMLKVATEKTQEIKAAYEQIVAAKK